MANISNTEYNEFLTFALRLYGYEKQRNELEQQISTLNNLLSEQLDSRTGKEFQQLDATIHKRIREDVRAEAAKRARKAARDEKELLERDANHEKYAGIGGSKKRRSRKQRKTKRRARR